jgi:hypothetical protein
MKHPEVAVVTGTNARLAWKRHMITNDISTENENKQSMRKEFRNHQQILDN